MPIDEGEPTNGRSASWTRHDLQRFEAAMANLASLRRDFEKRAEREDDRDKKLDAMSMQLAGLSKDFWYVKGIVLGFAVVVLIAFANALVNFAQTASAVGVVTP